MEKSQNNSLYPELVLMCKNAKLIFTSNGHEKKNPFNGYEIFEKRFEGKTRDRIKN
jgi:hypothetical protein